MTSLSELECLSNASILKGKVVLISGAASGLGRHLALKLGKEIGTKLILGDLNGQQLEDVLQEINGKNDTRQAVGRATDVTSYESLTELFKLGIKEFGTLDLVYPNAGVNEIGIFDPTLSSSSDGPPSAPDLTTLNIDLISVLYTLRLALFYFSQTPQSDDFTKAIVFTGSMSSFFGAPGSVMYSAAKFGVIGAMKGALEVARSGRVRMAAVCPFFVKTALLPEGFENPNPKKGFAKIEDVTAAFIAAATLSPSASSSPDGSIYLIPDKDGVVKLHGDGYAVGAGDAIVKRRGVKKAIEVRQDSKL